MSAGIKQAIERMYRRILLAAGRGRVVLVDDTGPVQKLQVRLGAMEVKDGVPRLVEYGLASNPPSGSDVYVAFIAGDRSNGVIIASGNQAARMRNLQPGEVAIYDDLGQSVYLTRNGIVINGAGLPLTVNNTPVVIVNAATKVALNTPELDVSGKIVAGGDITDNATSGGRSMAAMRQIYDGHEHPVRNVSPGGSTVTTDPPNQQE